MTVRVVVAAGAALLLTSLGGHGAPGEANRNASPERLPVLQSSVSGNPRHAHEPGDFQPFAEFAGDTVPFGQLARRGQLGAWYAERRGNKGLVVGQDPTAPVSPPNVIQTVFPDRYKAGRGPVNWGGWDAAGFMDGQKRAFYLSLWLKLDGPDFENQAVGTKLFYLGYGRSPEKTQSDAFLIIKGEGNQAVRSAFQLSFHQQGEIGSRNLRQNVVQRKLLTAGTWHQLEAVLRLNQPGLANGVFEMWLDDNQIMRYTNVRYLTNEKGFGFHGWIWDPVWGGTGGVRTRRDVISIDHVYMSGLPYHRSEPAGERLPTDSSAAN